MVVEYQARPRDVTPIKMANFAKTTAGRRVSLVIFIRCPCRCLVLEGLPLEKNRGVTFLTIGNEKHYKTCYL